MKGLHFWNRRDFIANSTAWVAASRLLGGVGLLGGQSAVAQSGPVIRKLGRTGIRLPIVSMGVMNADVPGLVRRSYEIGIRHFDTAAYYQQGRNEEMLGQVVKELGVRDKATIATKILRAGWNRRPRNQAEGQASSPEHVFTSAEHKAHFLEVFQGSLKRLQTDYVDILYNHAADTEEDILSPGVLEALTTLKREGKARFIGVSSHRPGMALKAAMQSGVYDVVLIQFNYTMANEPGLLETIQNAAKQGIGIVAMKTQAGGLTRPDPKLAAKPLTPASQTALLKWVLQHEAVTTAIPGYTTYDQMAQNFSVASNLTYTAEERAFLSDKKTVAEAQFCHQCAQCTPACPAGVDIPRLMRSHMYAVQYGNPSLAVQTVADIAPGRGLSACQQCDSCQAVCRNAVNIAAKIHYLKELGMNGRQLV